MSCKRPQSIGSVALIAGKVVLASGKRWSILPFGVALCGIPKGMTQGLLPTTIAHAAPVDLRGTAYVFFNLLSGLAMLLASPLAGMQWDQSGITSAFQAGGIFL